MTQKGKNGLKDIDTLLHAELSYLEIDTSIGVYPQTNVYVDNGMVIYKKPKEIGFYLIDKELGDNKDKYISRLEGTTVIGMANKPNGFSAIATRDSNGQIVISYRGTDMTSLKDWLDNGTTMLYADSSQSKDAQAFFDLVNGLREEKDRIALVGHSKGGELALKVALRNIDDISSVNTLSAQPPNTRKMGISEKELKNIIGENRDKFNLVRMEGDFVPFLGNYSDPFKDITRVINTNKYSKTSNKNIHVLSHSLSSIQLNGTNFEDSNGENVNTILFHTSIEELLTLAQYIAPPLIELIKVSIYEITEDINKIKEVSKFVIESIIEGTKNLVKEYVEEIIIKYTIVVNVIKTIFNIYKNSTNAIKSSGPEIKVDTQHLKDLARRLEVVRNRLNTLDGDLNYLYFTESLFVIKNLLKANTLLPSKRKVNGCIEYLEGTAIAFENAERKIKALI